MFIAGSSDGRIVSVSNYRFGGVTPLVGYSRTNFVSGIASDANSIYAVSYDDRVKKLSGSGREFTISGGIATSSQAKGVAIGGDRAYVLEADTVDVFEGEKKAFEKKLVYEATDIAASSSDIVAVRPQ